AAPLQRLELSDLGGIVRDDQLAALRVRHLVALAELVEQMTSFDAEPRLQRAGGIVDAGVDDAAVVGAGVLSPPRMALEDADRNAARRDRTRRGQAGDAGADDGNVDAGHFSCTGAIMVDTRSRRSRSA